MARARERGGFPSGRRPVRAAGIIRRRHSVPPSSSGLGHRPFKPAARIRIPLGAPLFFPAHRHFVVVGNRPTSRLPWCLFAREAAKRITQRPFHALHHTPGHRPSSGRMRARLNPAWARSSRYSAAVRSRPPTTASISRSVCVSSLAMTLSASFRTPPRRHRRCHAPGDTAGVLPRGAAPTGRTPLGRGPWHRFDQSVASAACSNLFFTDRSSRRAAIRVAGDRPEPGA